MIVCVSWRFNCSVCVFCILVEMKWARGNVAPVDWESVFLPEVQYYFYQLIHCFHRRREHCSNVYFIFFVCHLPLLFRFANTKIGLAERLKIAQSGWECGKIFPSILTYNKSIYVYDTSVGSFECALQGI